jgi:hypothetical protein
MRTVSPARGVTRDGKSLPHPFTLRAPRHSSKCLGFFGLGRDSRAFRQRPRPRCVGRTLCNPHVKDEHPYFRSATGGCGAGKPCGLSHPRGRWTSCFTTRGGPLRCADSPRCAALSAALPFRARYLWHSVTRAARRASTAGVTPSAAGRDRFRRRLVKGAGVRDPEYLRRQEVFENPAPNHRTSRPPGHHRRFARRDSVALS